MAALGSIGSKRHSEALPGHALREIIHKKSEKLTRRSSTFLTSKAMSGSPLADKFLSQHALRSDLSPLKFGT